MASYIIVTSKLATHALKMAGYSHPYRVATGTYENKLAVTVAKNKASSRMKMVQHDLTPALARRCGDKSGDVRQGKLWCYSYGADFFKIDDRILST